MSSVDDRMSYGLSLTIIIDGEVIIPELVLV